MTRRHSRRYLYLALVCALVATLINWKVTVIVAAFGYGCYALALGAARLTRWTEGRDVDGVHAAARRDRWKVDR